jgi:polysaccharide pyruvyl transferase WcaK-like protein
MHAAILRMSSGGTCVVIGYLPKAAALMSDLGLSRWHIPIASITSMQLQSAIDSRAQQAPLLTAALVRIDEQRSSWESELVNAGGVTAEK